MSRRLFARRTSVPFLILLLTAPVALAQQEPAFEPGVVVVQFDLGVMKGIQGIATGIPAIDRIAASLQVYAIERAFPWLDLVPATPATANNLVALRRTWYVRYHEPTDPREAAEQLDPIPQITYAEPLIIAVSGHIRRPARVDAQAQAAVDPDDAYYSQQTHLGHMRLPEAWNEVKGEEGNPPVVIAIVDSGVEWRHEDLRANVWTNPGEVPGNGLDDDDNGFIDDVHGVNFANADNADNDPSPRPGAFHGTSVAGAAAAVANNALGVAGSSWNARYMGVNAECSDDERLCFYSDGILYAAANGADLITASFGANYGEIPRLMQQVVEFATNMGVLIIGSAGNDGQNNDVIPFWPASHPRVLSVGSTEKDSRRKAGFSNYGNAVDVFAPGININTTHLNGRYQHNVSGTSITVPLVTGMAALVKTKFPQLSPDQLRTHIRHTAEDMDQDNPGLEGMFGGGFVNAVAALAEPAGPILRTTRWRWSDSDGNQDIRPGETVTVEATFVNELRTARDLSVGLRTDNPHLEPVPPTVHIGALETGDSIAVSLRFVVADEAPPSEARLIVRATDGPFVHEIDPFGLFQINPAGYRVHTTNTLRTSITDQAKIGYSTFRGLASGEGFAFRGLDLISEAGLLVGVSPEQVSDNLTNGHSRRDSYRGDRDFVVNEGTTIQLATGVGTTSQYGRVAFTDRQATSPMGISVLQESFTDSTDANEDFLILSFTIVNETNQPIVDLHAGLLVNWEADLGYPAERAWYNDAAEIGYVAFLKGGGFRPFAGIKVLTNTATLSHHVFDNELDTYDDGLSDEEKWTFLSGGIQRTSFGDDRRDLSQVTGAGPYRLDPGESVNAAFAIVAGNTSREFLLNVESAVALWDSVMPVFTEEPEPATPELFVANPVYPHPASLPVQIEFELNAAAAVTLEVYDVLGRRIRTLLHETRTAGRHSVTWDGLGPAGTPVTSGVYMNRWTVTGARSTNVSTQEFVIVR